MAKFHTVASNIPLVLYSRVKQCQKINGYTLAFMLTVGLLMFLKANHKERMAVLDGLKPRPKDYVPHQNRNEP